MLKNSGRKGLLILPFLLLTALLPGVTAAAADKQAQAGGSLTIQANPTLLTVSIPVTVNFDVDPTKEASLLTDGSGQLLQPELKIINRSIVPIDVTVSKVEGDVDLLTDSMDSLTATGRETMFGIKYQAPAGWDDQGLAAAQKNWLTESSAAAGYRLLPPPTALAADKQAVIRLYGRTGKGWKVEDTLTIRPTFVIAAASDNVHTQPDIGQVIS